MSSSSILYLKLIGSVIFWGGTWIAGRILAGDMTPYSAAFLRFLFATFFMFILVCRATGKAPKCNKEDVLPLIFLGITGVALYNIMFFTGLQTVTAGRAALIIAAVPTVIAIGSAIIFKEKFTLSKAAGFLIALVGVSTVVGDGNPLAILTKGISFGDLCIIGCVFSWTAYSLAGKPVMKRVSPLNAVYWSCLFGAMMLSIPAFSHGLIAEVKVMSLLDLGCLLFLAFLGTSLAFSWYCEAIGKIGPSKTGIFINLVPITAILLGAIILDEQIGMSLIIGGTLTISGVWITNRS
ncbi:DMT family transporter [Maridesulfovibrio ferrireducens]|uniref:DMT family transporter n=1 Tax=Maridesulfovibrio ferrireducens TaxID=246191 RepID=UPI001A1D6860|nr:DMT family transporter [Maridesulfovibrio ferrireducens]MBI9111007.1 DMT family transporter [Maridesulfovibrio ferrireducens]